ncbi:NUDIX hydrolase [Nocardioides yefusunii]|uniref:NUDIX hydrolase n=1 Tax=Nocardioides yefusunii TaxID=2500546 RepID=A0ABW1QZU9_9ACTN|nr:NUDIX domain-containing protein [Nocardioides yefusunii]
MSTPGAPSGTELNSSDLHSDALACLQAWASPAGRQTRLRDRFVAHLQEHPDGTARGCVPDHLTAGVLVLSADLDHVLLNLHRKARRWFHFGGHIEPGDLTLSGAALREGREESGIDDLDLDPVPVHVDEHTVSFCGDNASVQHLDVRFTALAPTDAVHAVSEESLDVRWWSLNALPDDLEDEMHEMIAAARSRWLT